MIPNVFDKKIVSQPFFCFRVVIFTLIVNIFGNARKRFFAGEIVSAFFRLAVTSGENRKAAVVKITAILMCGALSILMPKPSLSFDNERFVSIRPATSMPNETADHGSALSARDDFVIDASGQLMPSLRVAMLTTKGNIPVVRSSAEFRGAAVKASTDMSPNMNITYSSLGRLRSVRKCGPPPLSSAEIETLVAQLAEKHGVDPGFATAIAWSESRFDRLRNSARGARGPMQLMPDTATELGVSDVCDPATNIDAGIRHLERLFRQFDNPLLVAAAYNAGAQAVYDHGGVPPYPETVRYVASVINRQFGLPISRAGATKRPGFAGKSDVPKDAPTDMLGAPRVGFVKGVMHFSN